MPLATIKHLQYVTIGGGRSRQPRHPAAGAQPAGLDAISCYAQQPPNTFVTGSRFSAPYPASPAAFSCLQGSVFAFQSVTGLVEGGQISTDINRPCSGTVGATDIVVLNVYIPQGGPGGGGESGALIDAFDMETGLFCDDTFVSVNPDTTGSLTDSGNRLGWVSTHASNETITAFGHILPSDKYFRKWEVIGGTNQTNHALIVNHNSSPIAFAFYANPVTKNFFKDVKDHIKESLKDTIKDHKEFKEHKEVIPEIPPVKQVPDVKPPKELAEGPGPIEVWNPGEKINIQTLLERVSALEGQIQKLGQSFIKGEERPAVGKQLAQKRSKE